MYRVDIVIPVLSILDALQLSSCILSNAFILCSISCCCPLYKGAFGKGMLLLPHIKYLDYCGKNTSLPCLGLNDRTQPSLTALFSIWQGYLGCTHHVS